MQMHEHKGDNDSFIAPFSCRRLPPAPAVAPGAPTITSMNNDTMRYIKCKMKAGRAVCTQRPHQQHNKNRHRSSDSKQNR